MASDWEIVGQLEYSRTEALRKGAYGTVYKGEFDGEKVAVEKILLNSENFQERSEVTSLREGIWNVNLVRYFRKEEDKDFL